MPVRYAEAPVKTRYEHIALSEDSLPSIAGTTTWSWKRPNASDGDSRSPALSTRINSVFRSVVALVI